MLYAYSDIAAATEFLERRVQRLCAELKIPDKEQQRIETFLAPLKRKSPAHLEHYLHSLRVGLLAEHIAEFCNLDARALFYAGLLHDVGKVHVPPEVLGKVSGWNAKDAKHMRRHVVDGYRMIAGAFEFSARVILWHHRFQLQNYPARMPSPRVKFSRGTEILIAQYGRILALADFYDAAHRKNNKFASGGELGWQAIKKLALEQNPDQRRLIEDLYDADIFAEYDEREGPQDERQTDTYYPAAWEGYAFGRTPRETGRHVMLAAALEPLFDKLGCTTRHRDVSRHLKLEYFITAGINIGEPFERLAERFCENNVGPGKLYETALHAQCFSLRNRRGGRINHGIIELLVPIVAAQYRYDSAGGMLSTAKLLECAVDIMISAGRKEVDTLIEMKRLAWALCNYTEREVPAHETAQSVYAYYAADLAASAGNTTARAHNGEFVRGFPTVRRIYEDIMASAEYPLNARVKEAYQHACEFHDPSVGRGFLADCVAAALYLCFSQHPKERLVS